MNVLVINGSPKAKESITYHHVLFLEKHFKQGRFEHLFIQALVDQLDDASVLALIEKMAMADLVLFDYPVYNLWVPHQVILLMNAINRHSSKYLLKDSYVTQMSTSIHLFDQTAYHYMGACFEDWQMCVLEGHMAGHEDLLQDKGRVQLISFFDRVLHQMDLKYKPGKKYPKCLEESPTFAYEVSPESDKALAGILVIYNGLTYSETLSEMIKAFENKCAYRVHLLDLSNHDFKGSCMGCMRCIYTSRCSHQDDFEVMYQEKVANAEVIIMASDLENHYLHSDFKLFDDRSFYSAHNLAKKGKAIGYLVAGSMRFEPNLTMMFEARSAILQMQYLGMVSSEGDVEEGIRIMADQVAYHIQRKPDVGDNFYGLGGVKILRDQVYSHRSFMKDLHDFFKEANLYDFPKKHRMKHFFGRLVMRWLGTGKGLDNHMRRVNEYALQLYKKQIDRY